MSQIPGGARAVVVDADIHGPGAGWHLGPVRVATA
jgi:hypothetical protein